MPPRQILLVVLDHLLMSVFILMRNENVSIGILHQNNFGSLERKLGINTLGDTPISSNQPINYGPFHHASYHFDVNSDEWIKSGHPTSNGDVVAKDIFEDILSPEHVPLSAPSLMLYTL
ncbi:hypothetical protein J1N35_041818 [Gossypium stocksii]|uniref:Uncharacterized protein n=1 Tax=Gossypium stocksii TaxID=47602 RepID=A0A9D3ZJ01_9ROSI|nr:hypothetical protein J1N35_041818 [Gossypium stocksii]